MCPELFAIDERWALKSPAIIVGLSLSLFNSVNLKKVTGGTFFFFKFYLLMLEREKEGEREEAGRKSEKHGLVVPLIDAFIV